MVAFLGSTIGNFEPDGRADFLARIRAGLVDGETFLLGTGWIEWPSDHWRGGCPWWGVCPCCCGMYGVSA
jgi:hypothetical protein